MSSLESTVYSRILAKLVRPPESTDECWIWGGALSCGAPKIGVGSSSRNVRGVMLRQYVTLAYKKKGGIQRCGTALCINPWHMDPQHDWRAKIASTVRKGDIPFRTLRRLCKRGHPLVGYNRLRNGCRICRYTYLAGYLHVDLSRSIAKIRRAIGLEATP